MAAVLDGLLNEPYILTLLPTDFCWKIIIWESVVKSIVCSGFLKLEDVIQAKSSSKVAQIFNRVRRRDVPVNGVWHCVFYQARNGPSSFVTVTLILEHNRPCMELVSRPKILPPLVQRYISLMDTVAVFHRNIKSRADNLSAIFCRVATEHSGSLMPSSTP